MRASVRITLRVSSSRFCEQRLEVAHDRADEIVVRDGVEQLRRRRSEHRRAREQNHRDQRSEIGIRRRRPRRDVAALELGTQPVAVLEVHPWRRAQGLISDATTMVSSTRRQRPCGALLPEIASRRSTRRRFSSSVVCRLETTSTSRSLSSCRPPWTAEPKRYAPATSSPRTSRTRLETRSSCRPSSSCIRRPEARSGAVAPGAASTAYSSCDRRCASRRSMNQPIPRRTTVRARNMPSRPHA